MKKILMLLLPFFVLIACDKKEEGSEEKTNPDDVIQITVPEVVVPETIPEKGSTVTFTSTVPWSINLGAIRSSVPWLKIEPMSGPAGTANLTVTITEENPLYEDRSALVTINAGSVSKSFTVTQKQKDAIIASKDRIEIDGNGAEFVVLVESNISYEVVIPQESAEWIKQGSVSPSRASMVTKGEVFTALSGSEDDRRSGTIIFKSGSLADTVTVYQARKDVLVLSSDSIAVPYLGDDAIEVEIRSNVNYTVNIPSSASSWVSLVQPLGRAVRADRVYLKIAPNNNQHERTAKITFADRDSYLSSTLTIVQDKSELEECTLYIPAPGMLSQVMPDFYHCAAVKIVGAMGDEDFYFIRDEMASISVLDLSEAEVVSGEIPEKVFQNFVFEKFIFPKNITKIGDRAFYYAKLGDNHIELPETVTYIGNEAFTNLYCASFSANFPNVSYFGKAAFQYCKGFTGDLTIAGQSTVVENGAFNGTGFTDNLTIESGVVSIGNEAFLSTDFTGTITIKNGLKSIGKEAFGWTKFSGPLTIPASVEIINEGAFYSCGNFSGKLTVENGVIASEAFRGCGFTSLELKEGVASIGFEAFSTQQLSGNLVLPLSVDKIEGSAFSGCSFTSVTIKNPQTEYESNVFAHCQSIETVNLPAGMKSIPSLMFWYCTSLKSISLPSSLVEIGDEAFAWSGLTSLSLPSGIQKIRAYAFRYCAIGNHLTFPANLTYIGDYAFADNTNDSWTGYTLNNKVEYIGERALTFRVESTLVIPQSVKHIGPMGLNAQAYKVSWPVPIEYTTEALPYVGSSNSMLSDWQAVIYVPQAYVSAYQQAEHWDRHPIVGY